jgi:hypothetical protein
MFGKILMLVFLLSTTACASKVPECEPGKGVGCKSVTEVNRIVTNGELDNIVASSAEILMIKPYNPDEIVISEVRRLPEKVGRIWVNSFEDEMGDYIKETYVYTVFEKGRWVNVQ